MQLPREGPFTNFNISTILLHSACGQLVRVHVKVKVTLVQALMLCTGRRAYRRSRGIALFFLDHGTRRGGGSASRPGRYLTPGKTRYPLYRRLGGPQGRSGQVRKLLPPLGFYPRTVQPVASRYNDWAVRATTPRDYVERVHCYIVSVCLWTVRLSVIDSPFPFSAVRLSGVVFATPAPHLPLDFPLYLSKLFRNQYGTDIQRRRGLVTD
jgi:hypothetical protein